MSGGVDSSIGAALLAEAGWDVTGVTLKLWCYGESDDVATPRACCSLDAIEDARSVARQVGFPHHVLDETAEFRAKVVAPFVEDYRSGFTPYPCAACNTHLKFGSLFAHARRSGFEFLSTGHYVRATRAPRREGGVEPALARATHGEKDQAYALWGIERATLSHLVFPLGELSKAEVRAHGERLGLSRVAHKVESQDLCFVPDGDYAAFVERQAAGAAAPGAIVDQAGQVLGRHGGVHRFTVGQRRGLGLTSARPLYVLAVEPEPRTVVVGPEEELAAGALVARVVSWLSITPPCRPLRAQVKIRYRAAAAPATVEPLPHKKVRVAFDEPQRAVTPGQAAVFYDGEVCLGGAWIEARG
jgi:tRNA-specific 2-thiouridylase